MTTTEILEILRKPHVIVPRAELAEVASRREEFVPLLIDSIREATKLADKADLDDNLPAYALYLLAQLREPTALEPILQYFALDETTEEDIFGDVIAEDGARILAGVAHKNTERLQEYAKQPDLSLIVRMAAFDAIAIHSIWGETPKESANEFFVSLVDQEVFGKDLDSWTALASAWLDSDPKAALPKLRQLHQRQLLEEELVGSPKDWEKEARETDSESKEWREELSRPITDAADCVSWWECFDEGGTGEDEPGVPYVAPEKIGRNDLCPCGSGKKYKKCCMKE